MDILAVVIDLERPAHALLFSGGLAFIIVFAFLTGTFTEEHEDSFFWGLCAAILLVVTVISICFSFTSFTRLFRYGWEYRRGPPVQQIQESNKSVVEKLSEVSPEYTVENKPEVEPTPAPTQ